MASGEEQNLSIGSGSSGSRNEKVDKQKTSIKKSELIETNSDICLYV